MPSKLTRTQLLFTLACAVCFIFSAVLVICRSFPASISLYGRRGTRLTQNTSGLTLSSKTNLDEQTAQPAVTVITATTRRASHVTTKPAKEIASSAARRYMIYHCDKQCGGWADRLKGIVIAYVIATLTNRTFGIKMNDMPCSLTEFVLPNEVNWSVAKDVDLRSGARMYYKLDTVEFYDSVASVDLNTVFTSRVALFKANLDYFDQIKKNERYRQQLKWMRPLTYDQIFARIFRKLFKMSPKVQASLDSALRQSDRFRSRGGRLVCAHLRFAGNSEESLDTSKRHTKQHGETVLQFLQSLDRSNSRYNATIAETAFASSPLSFSASSFSPSSSPLTTNSSLPRFFVTGDSTAYINEAAEVFGERFTRTAGDFVHVDKPRGGAKQLVCDGFAKVIEDQQLLSRCDVLVVSKSGFSRQAAYLRGTDAGLYCVLLDGRLVKCQRSRLRELYGIVG